MDNELNREFPGKIIVDKMDPRFKLYQDDQRKWELVVNILDEVRDKLNKDFFTWDMKANIDELRNFLDNRVQ